MTILCFLGNLGRTIARTSQLHCRNKYISNTFECRFRANLNKYVACFDCPSPLVLFQCFNYDLGGKLIDKTTRLFNVAMKKNFV